MNTIFTSYPQTVDSKYVCSNIISGLGALGVALQNYPAVEFLLNGLVNGIMPANKLSNSLVNLAAFGAGGVCGGVVNFWMNVKLLDCFIDRMTSNKEYQYKQLSVWQQVQYFGGISVFVVTGVLFGLMAFTFAMEGPFAILSIAAGIFVAGIMTVQEVETWLSSYDYKEASADLPLTNEQLLGKWCGHLIAVGNVLALSVLFTLSLAQSLCAINIAIIPALLVGTSIAFTFGAFTEYYFYNVYLADFCQNFQQKWALMMADKHAWMGLLCTSTNGFVNAALTYTGVELLAALLVTAEIALPPVAALTALAVILACFAGSASLILGIDFWISSKSAPEVSLTKVGQSPHGLFAIKTSDLRKKDLASNDALGAETLCTAARNHI